jgi:hypothetical protein
MMELDRLHDIGQARRELRAHRHVTAVDILNRVTSPDSEPVIGSYSIIGEGEANEAAKEADQRGEGTGVTRVNMNSESRNEFIRQWRSGIQERRNRAARWAPKDYRERKRSLERKDGDD